MTHAEFNESVIRHLLHNKGWMAEKLARATGRRASVRADSLSSLSSTSTQRDPHIHRIANCDEKYESKTKNGKTKTYLCRWCAKNSGDALKEKRTSYYCKDCSDLPINEGKRVFLHPEWSRIQVS